MSNVPYLLYLRPEDEPPIWVDGIGPPLQQIEADMRELVDSTVGGIAQDALALMAEIRRLRGILEARGWLDTEDETP